MYSCREDKCFSMDLWLGKLNIRTQGRSCTSVTQVLCYSDTGMGVNIETDGSITVTPFRFVVQDPIV